MEIPFAIGVPLTAEAIAPLSAIETDVALAEKEANRARSLARAIESRLDGWADPALAATAAALVLALGQLDERLKDVGTALRSL